MSRAAALPVLIVSARGQACALTLADVVEIMRPLPVAPLADLPGFVTGMTVVRGAPAPVVDLGLLLGGGRNAVAGRFVSMRAAGRTVVLAVDDVRGVEKLEPATLESLPAAHAARGARAGLIDAVGTVGDDLLILVRTGAILAEDLWRSAERRA